MVEQTPHHHRTVGSAEDYPLERLEDPCGDRRVPDVPRPPKYPMYISNLFEQKDGKFSAHTTGTVASLRLRQWP